MSLADLFDLVAPLAIFHGADVTYKEEAAHAAARAVAAIRAGDSLAVSYLGLTGRLSSAGLLASGDFPNGRDVRVVYDQLLAELVHTVAPDWMGAFDSAGCRCFVVGGRRIDALCGDSPGHFAWYETAALVLERVRDHLSE